MPDVTDSLVLDLVEELYGGLVLTEAFGKREQQPARLVRVGKRSQQDQEKLEHNVARVSNAVGLAAGVAGTGTAVGAYRAARKDPQGQAGPINRKMQHKLGISRTQAARLTTGAAGAALALQFGNVAGDVVTARVLGRGSKKKETKAARYEVTSKVATAELARGIVTGMRRQVQTMTSQGARHAKQPGVKPRVLTEHPSTGAPLGQSPGTSSSFKTVGQDGKMGTTRGEQMSMFGPSLGEAKAATDPTKAFETARSVGTQERAQRVAAPVASVLASAKAHPKAAAGVGAAAGLDQLRRHRNTVQAQQDPYAMYKRDGVDEVTFGGSFSKFDEDKRLAFGWASVVELNGSPVIDRQGDYIALEDIENAAYVYVKKSGVGGDMHRRTADDKPHQVGKLVESVVFTPEKCEAMGVSKELVGKWWIGMHVDDDDAWEQVKLGKRAGFSIHGKGLRKDIEYDALMEGR